MPTIDQLCDHLIACADLWENSGVSRVKTIKRTANEIRELAKSPEVTAQRPVAAAKPSLDGLTPAVRAFVEKKLVSSYYALKLTHEYEGDDTKVLETFDEGFRLRVGLTLRQVAQANGISLPPTPATSA